MISLPVPVTGYGDDLGDDPIALGFDGVTAHKGWAGEARIDRTCPSGKPEQRSHGQTHCSFHVQPHPTTTGPSCGSKLQPFL